MRRACFLAAAVLMVSLGLWAQETGVPTPTVEVEGGLRHEFAVVPGGSYTGSILVRSKSQGPVTVTVTIRDLLYFADGRVIYGEPGTNPRTSIPWLTFFPKEVTLEPGQEMTISYRIDVPSDPELRGSYWCVLLISPQAPTPTGEGVVAIVQIVQYAVLIIADIAPNPGECSLKLADLTISRTEEGQLVQVDLVNDGERRLRPLAYLELYSSEGEYLGRFESSLGQRNILPGCSVRHKIPLPALDEGKYPALLVVDNLDECVWGTQVTIEVK